MSRPLVPLMTLALFVPAAASAPKLKDKGPPLPPIVGEWSAESRTIGGRAIALPADGLQLVFRADGTYTWVLGGKDADPDGHKYAVNAKAEPVDIDFVPRDKPPYLGVFKVEKDTLTLCFNRAGEPRPKAIESPAGTGTTLYVFRRTPKN